MIRCQVCQTENLEGSQYCDECGTVVRKTENKIIEKIDSGSLQPRAKDSPVFQSANVTSIGIPPIEEELDLQNVSSENEQEAEPKKINGTHAILIIERGEAVGTEFPLSTEESNIGRWDADNGIFPDVDLDSFDTEAKVSRRHARIIYQNNRYMIEDLGSTNGTFINRGRRLIPGNPHILNDGDEVIVGKTFLRFNIND
jgi:hypothetical protein